jgi:Domain of unknown function (DUF4337)
MSEEKEEKDNKKLETATGFLLALFAAILAIVGILSDKAGDDEKEALSEKNNAYQWYQSKSIKQTLTENELNLFNAMSLNGDVTEKESSVLDSIKTKLKKKISKYIKDKDEIMRGSKKVGKENWSQEDEQGNLGNIMGVDDWKEVGEKLGDAGDQYDKSNMFLQLCLVLGAICLITPSDGTKKGFMIGMILLGISGTGFAIYAHNLAQ